MASKKTQVEFRGFCQVFLDEADIKRLESAEVDPREYLDWLASMCVNGYRFTASQDELTSPVKVMIQDTSPRRTSAGWMLSADGTSLIDALMALRYKHEVKMGSDWVPFLDASRSVKRFR